MTLDKLHDPVAIEEMLMDYANNPRYRELCLNIVSPFGAGWQTFVIFGISLKMMDIWRCVMVSCCRNM